MCGPGGCRPGLCPWGHCSSSWPTLPTVQNAGALARGHSSVVKLEVKKCSTPYNSNSDPTAASEVGGGKGRVQWPSGFSLPTHTDLGPRATPPAPHASPGLQPSRTRWHHCTKCPGSRKCWTLINSTQVGSNRKAEDNSRDLVSLGCLAPGLQKAEKAVGERGTQPSGSDCPKVNSS